MRDIPYEQWQAIIGLEIHIQLNTRSKMFSTAANHFGDIPNTNISENCTGMPGALPTVNKEAVRKAVLFGLAINAEIANYTCFDRKSYFYPDTPRNFQITQFDHPIIKGGTITADVEGKTKKFAVDHAHLEDDAGMLKHFSSFAGIDYNRAGIPLLEIVSQPVIHTPKEAVAYVTAIKSIMEYIDASNCNMDEGSLRVDANISVRPKSETKLRNKTEIKNMNSFSFLEMAIATEIRRQIALYTENPHQDPDTLIIPGTYRWDSKNKEISLMRRKERHADYRYFPEPDLLPIRISKKEIQEIKESMPELPHERYKRYIQTLKLSEYSASLLVNNKALSDYFEQCLNDYPKKPQLLCNWITVEFMGRLKDRGESLISVQMPPQHVAMLIQLIDTNVITGKIAKQVADEMIKNPQKSPKAIIQSNPDYQPLSDTTEIEIFVDQVIKENPQSIIDFQNGKDKAFAYLVGQVMKLSKGKADPQIVNDLLHKKID